jgi:hypothetical protein
MEVKPTDQPMSLEDSAEDEKKIMNVETIAETWIALTIRNTPALTANSTITLPNAMAFSNH